MYLYYYGFITYNKKMVKNKKCKNCNMTIKIPIGKQMYCNSKCKEEYTKRLYVSRKTNKRNENILSGEHSYE